MRTLKIQTAQERVAVLREELGRDPTAIDIEMRKAAERAKSPMLTYNDPGTASEDVRHALAMLPERANDDPIARLARRASCGDRDADRRLRMLGDMDMSPAVRVEV